MAYKGVNTSAKYAKQLSPFEKTLRECPLESVNVLLTLTKNTAQSPSEEKFRKIRLANSKIKQVIGDVPPALEALRSMGWVSEDVDGEPCMMLPSTVVIKFEVVRTIDEALVDVKRETEKSMRRAISARSVASNPEKVQHSVQELPAMATGNSNATLCSAGEA
eukprot:scaffold3502_cov350-Prasinococcus_capsulatus_cf.AAC.4